MPNGRLNPAANTPDCCALPSLPTPRKTLMRPLSLSDTNTSPFGAVFQTVQGGGEGVEVSEVVEDLRPVEKRYLPGHPDADAEGYVSFPNVNPAEDMADLLSATRGYQGDVAAISAVKSMISQAIQLLGA